MAAKSIITDEQLIEKYVKYSQYWAGYFLNKNRINPKEPDDYGYSIADLAQEARLKLLKVPQKYRGEHNYCVRVMINAIMDAMKKRHKWYMSESQPPIVHIEGDESDFFDTLEAQDGLVHLVHSKLDSFQVDAVFAKLKRSERVVIELHFGITGLEPLNHVRIARRLARTEDWVERKLRSGIDHIRRELKVARR